VAAILSPQSSESEAIDGARFSVKTRIRVRCAGQFSRDELKKKLESLAGRQIHFESKSRVVTKKIYSARVRKIGDQEFYLYLEADGGLGIKQFVHGDGVGFSGDGNSGGISSEMQQQGQRQGQEQQQQSLSSMGTSVSQILGANCECVNFDILSVMFLSNEESV
jgi:tRNA U54 and U55 pseudouridine synthase Pus10